MPDQGAKLTPGRIVATLAGDRRMGWLANLPLWRGAVVLAYHRMYHEGDETPLDPGTLSATP
ncbi:MAG TPA: hypothetical protein VK926_08925, partial [Gaiellaceae bacterium]|nr:hypothetical protein [Gaiellaceae bacterium]